MSLLNAQLPDDVIRFILLELKTYDQMALSVTNKRLNKLCNTFYIQILSKTLQYKTIACHKNATYIIKNNQLYKILDNTYQLIHLPENDKPVYITSFKCYSLLILTKLNKLYLMNDQNEFKELKTPRGQIKLITQGRAGEREFYVITNDGLYQCHPLTEKIKKININEEKLLSMVIGDYDYIVMTTKGVWQCQHHIEKLKYINIDDINDVLSISLNHGYSFYLTTTGLYKNGWVCEQFKLNLHQVKAMASSSFETLFLTCHGLVYRYKDFLLSQVSFDHPIINMIEDNDIIIFIDNQQNYFRLDTTYKGNTSLYQLTSIHVHHIL